MSDMDRGASTQWIVFLVIVIVGGGLLLGEMRLVRWWPEHQQRVADQVLTLAPYQNDSLGIQMQVAWGLYGNVEQFAGGVKIYRPRFYGAGPTLTISSQPNEGAAAEFTPEILAKWQTAGVTADAGSGGDGRTSPALAALAQANMPQYSFEHVKINDRDAALIWQYRNQVWTVTAHVISPAHIIEASCTPGDADVSLYLQACDKTLHSIQVAGPASPQPVPQGIQEIQTRH